MKKWLFTVIIAVLLFITIAVVGINYSAFVSNTIYSESTSHLTAIFHQANRSLNDLVGGNWENMHIWADYLQDVSDEKEIDDFLSHVREETGFTDFYFISREGNYQTVNNERGYLDLKDELPELILNGKDTVVNSVVPGEPQIMVFVTPAAKGTYTFSRRPYAFILTAYDWTDIEVEARAAGVTAFCSKPMFMSDLRESLLNALGQQKEKEETTFPATSETNNFKGKRLLLVEDNELNREIAFEILNEYGFIVDTAENGKKAVEKISASKPGDYDLVLMDIQMPVMDGHEAARQIRALKNPELSLIPIVAMTANAFEEDRRSAKASGMDGFISKPISISEVVQALNSVFDRA